MNFIMDNLIHCLFLVNIIIKSVGLRLAPIPNELAVVTEEVEVENKKRREGVWCKPGWPKNS